MSAGLDPLCDDAWEYARTLADAGVEVRMTHRPGMLHGFLPMAGALPEAARTRDDAFTALGRTLHG